MSKCLICKKEFPKLKYYYSGTPTGGVCEECNDLSYKLYNMFAIQRHNITPRFADDIKEFILSVLGKEIISCKTCGMRQGKDLVGWSNNYTICPHCTLKKS